MTEHSQHIRTLQKVAKESAELDLSLNMILSHKQELHGTGNDPSCLWYVF